MKKQYPWNAGIGMLTAALIGLSAACTPASIEAASSVSTTDITAHQEQYAVIPNVPSVAGPSITGSSSDASSEKDEPSGIAPADVRRAATEAVRSLAGQAPFAAWQNADLSYQPLGPGTHSWLVQLNRQGEDIGYLIIGADPDGSYHLHEYGTGPRSPYSLNTLQNSLHSLSIAELPSTVGLQITPIYEEPLLAYWLVRSSKGDSLYIDAFSGVPLPSDITGTKWKNKLTQTKGKQSTNITAPLHAVPSAVSHLSDNFNLYDNLGWIKQKQPLSIHNSNQFLSTLRSSPRLVFNAADLNFAYGGPFGVNGYQQWSTTDHSSVTVVYAAVCNDKFTRFVPLQRLLSAQALFKYQ